MSEKNNQHGKRKVRSRSKLGLYWAQYKDWVANMDRGQRIRHRLLQAAVAMSVVIIVVYLILSAWVKVPDLPDFGQGSEPGNIDVSGGVSFDGAEVPDIVRSGRKEGVYTFLLVGRDVASGSTDTMLLLTYDTKEKTIHGLNLPRDTMVNVSTTSKRLNAVFSYNKGKDKKTQVEKGMAALKTQVSKLTGITPDFYVLVEWEAIGKLVDALGGVEFEVPFDMDYDDPYQNLHIHQKAGLRVLTGDDAMQVIRFRKSNDRDISLGDVGRLDIQQDFLKAVAKKCLQPATFLKIPSLVEIFTENVETDLTVGNILAFAQLAYGMDPDAGVSFETAPLGSSFSYRGAALVSLDETKLLKVLNDGMNPYLRDIKASDLELVYRKSNGSFGVTNGTLADPKMGQVPVVSKPQPEPEPEKPVDTGDTSQDPENPETGDSSTQPDQGEEVPGGDSSQPGDTSQPGDVSQPETGDGSQSQTGDTSIGTIDPDLVLPDPSVKPEPEPSQDIQPGEPVNDHTVAVLPARPQPVEEAA